ncbi:MAG: hypothetical protein QGH76_00680 [Phycisphaerales bacterium]|jgi:hypothetical protein|nr:hypothetical protein [Phycisphaerales bacterium]
MSSGRGRTIAAWSASALLLGSAIWLVASKHDDIAAAIASLERPDPFTIVLLLLTMAASIPLHAESFRRLLNRRGNVGSGEMVAVIASASLLNWMPLRAGLIGRLAYHHVVNSLPLMWTIRVQFEVVALVGFAAMVAILVAIAAPLPFLGVPLAVALVVAVNNRFRPWMIAWSCRYVDLLFMATRYWLIFRLLNQAIEADAAIALAAAGAIASLVPLPAGGLGAREWVIGWVSLAITSLPFALATGILADLVNRIVELIVVVPAGLLGGVFVRRQLLRSASDDTG